MPRDSRSERLTAGQLAPLSVALLLLAAASVAFASPSPSLAAPRQEARAAPIPARKGRAEMAALMSGLLLQREGCQSESGRLRVNMRRRDGVSCRECRGGADEQQISAEMVQKLMKERDQALEREKEALKKVEEAYNVVKTIAEARPSKSESDGYPRGRPTIPMEATPSDPNDWERGRSKSQSQPKPAKRNEQSQSQSQSHQQMDLGGNNNSHNGNNANNNNNEEDCDNCDSDMDGDLDAPVDETQNIDTIDFGFLDGIPKGPGPEALGFQEGGGDEGSDIASDGGGSADIECGEMMSGDGDAKMEHEGEPEEPKEKKRNAMDDISTHDGLYEDWKNCTYSSEFDQPDSDEDMREESKRDALKMSLDAYIEKRERRRGTIEWKHKQKEMKSAGRYRYRNYDNAGFNDRRPYRRNRRDDDRYYYQDNYNDNRYYSGPGANSRSRRGGYGYNDYDGGGYRDNNFRGYRDNDFRYRHRGRPRVDYYDDNYR